MAMKSLYAKYIQSVVLLTLFELWSDVVPFLCKKDHSDSTGEERLRMAETRGCCTFWKAMENPDVVLNKDSGSGAGFVR